ncbi:MAG: helix-turn-helix transcriptional regulator [Bacteroidota bacterium]
MSITRIKSISELHTLLGFPKPKYPLISLLDVAQMEVPEDRTGDKAIWDFYMISLKDRSCGVKYGRNSFDFDEGVMAFSAPGQVYQAIQAFQKGEIQGWMLFFHPDLIRNTHLSQEMENYSFFDYEVVEALHLSEDEEATIHATVANIKKEYEQRVDGHSQRVIVSHLELLLNYCRRFYERQFRTRVRQRRDVIAQFERELKRYFKEGKNTLSGLPEIQYFAERAHLSQHYFSDLIKNETGRKPKDHINEYVVEKAKNILLATEHTISEVAYDLGFNSPNYFSRLFKAKTGFSPLEYRKMN